MRQKSAILDQWGKPIARSFEAAKGTRYTGDWLASQGPADRAIKQDVKSLRERARQMERDDSYTESWLMELVSNVIGPKGIRLKSLARKMDARANGGMIDKLDEKTALKIEQAWEDYSKKGNFEVTRQHSRPEFERLSLRSVARDGGALVRMVDGIAKNRFRFMVQGIEIDALDPRTNMPEKRVIMGVEFDEWDEPVAYHLTKIDPKGYGGRKYETYRVEADKLLNLFMSHRFGQTQGYSWLAPIMLRLRHLSKYEESEVIAAREGSNKIGFFEQTDEAQYTGADLDGDGRPVVPSAPGQWESLPKGIKPHLIDPSHPNSNYPDFRKAILRGGAMYLNYNTWAKDLEGVNYSSIRQGTLSEREIYRILQDYFIGDFEIRVFNQWLKMALLAGEIEGLSPRDFDRCCYAEFSGRTWAWVDPAKDIAALKEEIALGLNSRSAACREKGKDFDKILAENESDTEKLDAAGLLPVEAAPVAAAPVAPKKKEDEEED
jgi:lambda family phage portal protein